MKKSLVALSLIGIISILPVSIVLAQVQPGGGITLDSLTNSIKSAIWKVFGIIALIMFIVAGILFLTSSGDAEKVKTARTAFIWGVIGVVVGILAYSIVQLVQYLMPS